MSVETKAPATAAADPKEMVRDMVKEIFREMAPIFKDIALTPEKIKEINKPYVDPLKLARELREQQKWRADDAKSRKDREDRQARCTHKDKNLKWAVRTQHNFHDNMPRGICPLCELFIHPAYWDFRPVDGKDVAFIVPEHPSYHIVREIESMS
jgi:hypothetical protein